MDALPASSRPIVSRSSGFRAALTLGERELVRFFRQRNRVFGAACQPLLFWALFGIGLQPVFRPTGAAPDLTYGEYLVPGIVVLMVLFTAIFSTISIIEDRREGFLQGVLIAPVARPWIVLGKLLGGAAIAVCQAWLFVLLAPVAGVAVAVHEFLLATAHLFIVAVGLTALGVCFAWKTDSVQGFHAIMMVVLMPMWLLSGAFFPSTPEHGWLRWIIAANPVTYTVSGLRRILYLDESVPFDSMDTPSLPHSIIVTGLFAGAAFLLACRLAGQQSAEAA
jgi:ABC-2 type transport system permease protein